MYMKIVCVDSNKRYVAPVGLKRKKHDRRRLKRTHPAKNSGYISVLICCQSARDASLCNIGSRVKM